MSYQTSICTLLDYNLHLSRTLIFLIEQLLFNLIEEIHAIDPLNRGILHAKIQY